MHHCTNACRHTLRGFIAGDWGFPIHRDAKPDPSKMPPAESMPTVASLDLVRRQVVHYHDVALFERRHKGLFHMGMPA